MSPIIRLLNNKSRVRRLFLIRKFQYKMRSLKRSRCFLKLSSPKIGDEYALEIVFKELIGFLGCSFNDINDESIVKPLKSLVSSMENLVDVIGRHRETGKPIPKYHMKLCAIAVKNLYHSSKKSKLYLECDSFWNQFGLALIVLYRIK